VIESPGDMIISAIYRRQPLYFQDAILPEEGGDAGADASDRL
jgi:hypothetical protein